MLVKDYNGHYDPLKKDSVGSGYAYAPTYWVGTAGTPPQDDGVLENDIDAEVVIVGSGFTGLCCAIFLAQEHGIKAVVLEANKVSWGCSVRNGGQAQFAAGRLSRSQWITRYGLEVAQGLHKEMLEGFDNFRELIKDIDCEPQDEGHLYIAHNKQRLEALIKEADVLKNIFSYQASVLSKEEVKERYVDDAESNGAMVEVDGVGVHSGKLAFGYLEKARALGVKVYVDSAVTACEKEEGGYRLVTAKGSVRTKKVAFCTAGYTSNFLHGRLKNKLMPILSNSLVTRPLNEEQLKLFHSNAIITDTRTLRHYYRLLPDNRLQIGSRSAISGASSARVEYRDRLYAGLLKKFPSLEGIPIEYYWWGWVDVSHDTMPRITEDSQSPNLYYALGYGGNGVMYSSQAGRRLAELVAGKKLPELPIFGSDLKYPMVGESISSNIFAPFRRLGQRFLYVRYAMRDEKKN